MKPIAPITELSQFLYIWCVDQSSSNITNSIISFVFVPYGIKVFKPSPPHPHPLTPNWQVRSFLIETSLRGEPLQKDRSTPFRLSCVLFCMPWLFWLRYYFNPCIEFTELTMFATILWNFLATIMNYSKITMNKLSSLWIQSFYSYRLLRLT